MSTDGSLAVSSGADGLLSLWNLKTRTRQFTLEGHTRFVREVALTPDGRRLASASYDRTARIWDPVRGTCLTVLDHADSVLCVALTADGRRAITGGDANGEGPICLWDAESGQCLRTWSEHNGWVTHITLTPDGRLAFSASNDTTIRVWDLAAQKCVQALRGHTDEVLDVSVTPDGRFALSASDDNTVRLWNVATGQCLAVYHAGAEVRSVSPLRADGRFLCGTVTGQIHRLTLRKG